MTEAQMRAVRAARAACALLVEWNASEGEIHLAPVALAQLLRIAHKPAICMMGEQHEAVRRATLVCDSVRGL